MNSTERNRPAPTDVRMWVAPRQLELIGDATVNQLRWNVACVLLTEGVR